MPAGIAHVTLTDVLKGDPRTITVEVVNGGGNAVPLDGATWASTVRRSPQSSTGIDLTIDTSQAADGVLGLTMSGDQTRTLSRGGIYGDLEGSTFGTILTFDAPVRDDVTRGASEPTGGLVDAITVIYDDTGTTLSETVLALLVTSETPGGAGTHPDLATHDALGLATDDELVAEQTARADADTALAVRLDTVETTLPLKADLVAGVVPDGQLPAGLTRDVEMAAYVDAAIDGLLDGAPGALDTLNELAAAIGDDADFAATVTAALAGKQAAAAELTVLSGLSSTALGRTLLTIASETAARTAVGLGNVDNTADLSKPISTATQTALDAKAPTASPALTGNPTAPTQTAGNDSTRIATTAFVKGAVDNATSNAVQKSTLDANTLLGATVDNTPVAFPVAASRIVGRKATGDIDDLTTAELAALFGTPDGTKFLADDGTLKTPAGGGSGAVPLVVYKTADETVNNSNTLQDDDALAWAVTSGEVWTGLLVVSVHAHPTGDIQFQATEPGGTSAQMSPVVYSERGDTLAKVGTGTMTTAAVPILPGLDGAQTMLFGVRVTATATGTARIRWAQVTAAAVDCKVKAGSFLMLTKGA